MWRSSRSFIVWICFIKWIKILNYYTLSFLYIFYKASLLMFIGGLVSHYFTENVEVRGLEEI
jgi:hypothetical protein